ncbi:MAG: hypothetical protein ABL986_12570 [Vicinamibacterales bacterium]
MLAKGIDTTIRELIEQLPQGANAKNANSVDFEALLAPLAAQLSSAIIAATQKAANTASPAAAATTATASTAPESTAPTAAQRLNLFQLSLLRDRNSTLMQQLPNELTAGDPQYNQREALLRDNLDVNELERRLQASAREFEVPYDRSDLEGVLRNAGYDAAHLGSSERYMAAIERFMGEARKNYQRGATNIPGQG